MGEPTLDLQHQDPLNLLGPVRMPIAEPESRTASELQYTGAGSHGLILTTEIEHALHRARHKLIERPRGMGVVGVVDLDIVHAGPVDAPVRMPRRPGGRARTLRLPTRTLQRIFIAGVKHAENAPEGDDAAGASAEMVQRPDDRVRHEPEVGAEGSGRKATGPDDQ